jgi:hypothetical protein
MRLRTTIITLFAAVLLIVALAACSGQTTEAPAVSGGDSDSAEAAPAAESEAEPAAPTATAVSAANEEVSEVSMNGPSGCTAFSVIPEPNPTLEALFPPPGADDHVKGPAEASVTVIEYSDFQ